MLWRRDQTLSVILREQERIVSALDDLTAEVAALSASINAAITALGTKNDAAQLAAITATLKTGQQNLDAAVAATQVSS